MACFDPASLPIIEQVSLALTQIPIGVDSLPPFSVKPIVFTRYPDYSFVGDNEISFYWGAGSYKPISGSIEECDLLHAPEATMLIRVDQMGIDTMVYITAISRGKVYTELYRVISNSLVSVHLRDSSGYKCHEPLNPFVSSNNLLGMIQELVLGSELSERNEDSGSIVEKILLFDYLTDVWVVEPTIGCPISFDARSVPITQQQLEADDLFYLYREYTDAQFTALLALRTVVSIGELLSGTIPTKVILPVGGCSYIDYEILEEQQIIRPVAIFRRASSCSFDWIESKIDFSGICISVNWPDEENEEEPPPLSENLPPGVSISNHEEVPDPPPGSTIYPGLGFIPPVEMEPCFLENLKILSTQNFTYQDCTVGAVDGESNCFGVLSEENYILESNLTQFLHCGRPLYQSLFRLRRPKCQNGWVIGYENWYTVGGDFSGIQVYSDATPHQFSVVPCSTSTCSKWLTEIVLVTNGTPPFPAGLRIRNYIEVVCGSRPGLIYEQGIAYITCGGDTLGPIGFAASTYRWFRFEMGMSKCIG